MNMEESLSLSQKVSDDPPGEVTNESETDPVTKHSNQKTNMEESPDEDFVSVKVSVTDTIKKFLVRDTTKKYPKLNRAPTVTTEKDTFKSKMTPRARRPTGFQPEWLQKTDANGDKVSEY